jgi:hypothetical protein
MLAARAFEFFAGTRVIAFKKSAATRANYFNHGG